MEAQSFLTPDQRWTIWGCNSHQEYLDRFLIKGRFHPQVPEDIKIAYETVERLMTYSYFYYPLTEEVVSKLTRIFEMAVKNRAKGLGVSYKSLSNCITVLSVHPDIDSELALEWKRFKDLRNFCAHPETNTISGPLFFRSGFLMVNLLKRIFCSKNFLTNIRERLIEWQKKAAPLGEGVFIFETMGKSYLLTGIKPVMITPDEKLSFWCLLPIPIKFPQNMEEYQDHNPFFVRLSNIHYDSDSLTGYDSISESNIKIVRTTIDQFLQVLITFKEQYESSDPVVKDLNLHNIYTETFHEKERFIYDEFWNG